ncbi:MAG: 16S rRNA (cytosine(1402)-N(4))-methyltransferase RsmH [Bacilli bacterium]|nr:16S rRNA (cytosine(1402)-N(4))-methyltransferase RsmH [Bacilli bacterium]
MEKHISVLKNESIESLNLKEDSIVVDATLGYGGHSSCILKRISRGHLFAFDQDSEAIRHSTDRLKSISTNFTIIKSNFSNMKEELKKRDVNEVDSILFDLGVSSPQLDDTSRGFSYHKDAVLDMRMDKDNPITAKEIVNNYSKEELSTIFSKYGEAKFARNIAKKIVEYRENKEIESTLELVDIIKSAVPMKFRIDKHPAKQIFQAIRIEVNKELDVIPIALEQALDLIKIGGRVAVITFHSLEDRIVKNIFKEKVAVDKRVQGLPDIPDEYLPNFKLVINKAIKPSKEELSNNPRSRSAKLRVIEKIR